jgi:tetratricopeptide (TPR) repeat protein
MISGHTDLAIAHLRQQLVLRPEDALLHTMLGLSLLQAGLLPEALSEAICGAELDPRCAFATSSVAVVHYHMRHYDDALYHSHRAEAQSPEFDAVKLLIGDIYLHSGFHRAAIGRLEDACRLTANHPLALAHLGYGYARTGRYGEARRLLGALQGGAAGNAALLALVNAGLGESDAALGHLEQALESRTHMPELLLHSSPAYDGLRAHPRFPALLASLG